MRVKVDMRWTIRPLMCSMIVALLLKHTDDSRVTLDSLGDARIEWTDGTRFNLNRRMNIDMDKIIRTLRRHLGLRTILSKLPLLILVLASIACFLFNCITVVILYLYICLRKDLMNSTIFYLPSSCSIDLFLFETAGIDIVVFAQALSTDSSHEEFQLVIIVTRVSRNHSTAGSFSCHNHA